MSANNLSISEQMSLPTRYTKPAAPFNQTDSSYEAALAVEHHLQAMEARVLRVLIGHPAAGLTQDAIAKEARMKLQTVNARVNALVKRGLVVVMGRRPNLSGNKANVYGAAVAR